MGPVVTAIQRALAKAGSDPGPLDGAFGKGTDAAVRRYQKAHRRTVDGVVGPVTAARLGVTLKPTRSDTPIRRPATGRCIGKSATACGRHKRRRSWA